VNAPRVFLAWSRHMEESEALLKALDIVKAELRHRAYGIYDWSEQHHIRNIGKEIEDQIRSCDLVILESSTGRPNPAFEVGFARYPGLPIIVLKQEGSSDLPEDYGAPKYLRYPNDKDKEPLFKRFETDLRTLLDTLEAGTLSPGHRGLRRALSTIVNSVQQMIDHHHEDHAHLYLAQGWINKLAADVREGGPSTINADADDYVHMFSALQQRVDFRFRAIADLTDDTEPFWEVGHPEPMSTAGSQRIFLIDWRLFFEREQELSGYLDSWCNHLQNNPDYEIYVTAKADLDLHVRHPFGRDAVGLHLLLVEPGQTFGGYRRRNDYSERRMFCMVKDELRYETAETFYNAVLKKAVPLKHSDDFVSLKRAWLTNLKIGYWDAAWTQQTERRSPSYFERYDQHIRCWIPSYDELIKECAAMIAREILRTRQRTGKPVNLLEVGYGTGSLISHVEPWIRHLSTPFEDIGDLPPVENYYAVDRADQMRVIARKKLGAPVTSWVRMLKQLAWREVRTDVEYDVIFGSLVTHFMLDREDESSVDNFFAECARRMRGGGSLVFADSFGQGGAASKAEDTYAQWRDWMVRNGLSEAYADSFLEGNQDMVNAFSVDELARVAVRHGFSLTEERTPGLASLFKVVAFHHMPAPEQPTG
jgi:SAM-dependent methyltransferase